MWSKSEQTLRATPVTCNLEMQDHVIFLSELIRLRQLCFFFFIFVLIGLIVFD